MPNRALLTAAAALATCLVLLPAAPSFAATTGTPVRTFKNCTELRKIYPAGVAKAGVTKDRTPSGARRLKGNVKVSTPLYLANRKLDRDRDGIACERG